MGNKALRNEAEFRLDGALTLGMVSNADDGQYALAFAPRGVLSGRKGRTTVSTNDDGVRAEGGENLVKLLDDFLWPCQQVSTASAYPW